MVKNGCILIAIILLIACARKGSPSGGPKDVTPPLFLKATPDTFGTSISPNTKEIRIDFDEYITLKDPLKQIIISPPFTSNPQIYPTSSKPRKYVLIKLTDTLEANTTYNINFGESIQDLNESNTLPLFNYVFSTGDKIDSLQLKGSASQALSTQINPKTVFALYKEEADTINLLQKPYYIAKTDPEGNFQFKYLHQGDFQLIAFTDENSNLRYDADELIAFTDSLVNPLNNQAYSLVLAPNIPTFKILSTTQTDAGEIEIVMQGRPKKLETTFMDKKISGDYTFVHKEYSDSAYFYFNPKELKINSNKDRLKLGLTQQNKTDTISVLYDAKLSSELTVKLMSKNYTPKEKVYLESNHFINMINLDSIQVWKDSLPISFRAEIDSLRPKNIKFTFPIQFASAYNITLFPGALTDQSQNKNDTLTFSLKTQNEKNVGNLILQIQNPPTHPYFLQLLDKDKVVQTVYGNQDKFNFQYLLPKEYSFRILVDENENGIWDMADFENRKQAEKTYLLKKTIAVRAFWDINETWALP